MKKFFLNIWTHKTKRDIAFFCAVTLVFFAVFISFPHTTLRGLLLRTILACVVWPCALFFAFSLSDRVGGLAKIKKLQAPLVNAHSLDLLRLFAYPVVVSTEKGKVIWLNPAAEQAWDNAISLLGKNIDEFCAVKADTLLAQESEGGTALQAFGIPYQVHAYLFSSKNKPHILTVWENREQLYALTEQTKQENPMIAYIMVDNLEELLQYAKEQSRTFSLKVGEELQGWADQMGGVLHEYDRDRYLLFFPAGALKAQKENHFDILNRIREIRLGDGSIPVTVSVGISSAEGDLLQKEKDARAALDMAMQRGGDQVVLKTEDSMEFYGGHSKGVQTRTKVRARRMANELAALISRSSNVLIMGHRAADFDAFGSAVGLARLCMFCGVDVNIVCDRQDPNLRKCFDKILLLSEYRNVFINASQAQDMLNSDTLLIITDANNPTQFESLALYKSSFTTVIIDHHRKAGEFENPPRLAYIEPSASSACEMVSEILEQSLPAGSISKEEADLMFAGILLDTTQFARNTGVRTFGAALFLRNEGANPVDAQALFKIELNDYLREARFAGNVYLYCSVIAIAVNQADDNTSSDRIVAAKCADKLLSVDGVQASFAVCKIENSIFISARSSGSVNVQLILEKLHGGGHFDSAGARLDGVSVESALTQLKKAIDDYLGEIQESKTAPAER